MRRRWQPSPSAARLLLLCGVLLILVAQAQLAARDLSVLSVLLYVAGLAIIVRLDGALRAPAAPETLAAPPSLVAGESRRRMWLRLAILGLVAICAMTVVSQEAGRPPRGEGYFDTAALWLVAMLGTIVASAWPVWSGGAWPHRLWRSVHRDTPAWSVALVLVVAAFAVRAVALDQVPYLFNGDEAAQAMSAVAILNGEMTNPFATGWSLTPTLFFFLQAASIRLFGDSPAGVRLVSALIGASAVLFTYLLGRRIFGQTAAIVAAALLAFFHYHVHFSRIASVQVLDALVGVMALYFLDRAVVGRRGFDGALAGIAIGLSQYSSPAAWVIPFIAVGYVVFQGLRDRSASGRGQAVPFLRGMPFAWIVAGAVVACMPLLAHYASAPHELDGRIDQASIFASGWLAREAASTRVDSEMIVATHLLRAVLIPFHTIPSPIYYAGEAPFVGFPFAILTAIGLALVSARPLARTFVAVGLPYWAAVVGLAITEDPTQTQRFVIAAPFIALLAAVALVRCTALAMELGKLGRWSAIATVLVAVVGLSIWSLNYYFFADHDAPLYGDENTLVVTDLAYYLRSRPGGETVYFLGAPRILYSGFPTLPFLAGDSRGIDIVNPIGPTDPPPRLQGTSLFVLLPERSAELAQIRRWFPRGQITDVAAPDGPLLFTVYEPDPS